MYYNIKIYAPTHILIKIDIKKILKNNSCNSNMKDISKQNYNMHKLRKIIQFINKDQGNND